MSVTKQPGHGEKARRNPKAPQGDAAARPVVPAIPSESGVGEEDPGDFENASIRSDDGKRPRMPQPKPGERR
jgi:hypothetical protein